jgi:hypothetical protein
MLVGSHSDGMSRAGGHCHVADLFVTACNGRVRSSEPNGAREIRAYTSYHHRSPIFVNRMALTYHRPKVNLFGNFEQRTAERAVIPAAVGSRDWTAWRTTRTLDIALPVTLRWGESLPETAKATTLIQTYPRIANRIASAWRDERTCLAVLDELLVDRRGGRRGFGPMVQAELLALRSLRDGGHSLYPGPFYASPKE